MSGHTPGPWKTHGGPGRLGYYPGVIDSIPDVGGKIVANSICHVAMTNQNSDANAKLIAAAPDLLAALQEVVDDGLKTNMKSWQEKAILAIKKATE